MALKNYGENLRILRQAKGISQHAMAYHLNISQTTYSRIERGIFLPDQELKDEIAITLEVPPTELMAYLANIESTISTPARKWEQKAKDFIDMPLGMVTVFTATAAIVAVVYVGAHGICLGLQTTAATLVFTKWIAALMATCFICYWVRKIKNFNE